MAKSRQNYEIIATSSEKNANLRRFGATEQGINNSGIMCHLSKKYTSYCTKQALNFCAPIQKVTRLGKSFRKRVTFFRKMLLIE